MKAWPYSVIGVFLTLMVIPDDSLMGSARSAEPPKSYSVMILDMSRTAEPDSGSRVSGFPTYELAKEFLKRRVRDSIEELRKKQGQSREELKKLWLIYGESGFIVADDEKYEVRSEIDFFVEHPATQEERDWQAIKKKAGIK